MAKKNSPSDVSRFYGDIYADLSQATAATINEMREAFRLQAYMEQAGGYRDPFTLEGEELQLEIAMVKADILNMENHLQKLKERL